MTEIIDDKRIKADDTVMQKIHRLLKDNFPDKEVMIDYLGDQDYFGYEVRDKQVINTKKKKSE
jgi:tRNA(Ser,Leu) C12 N-acetylase TAN1